MLVKNYRGKTAEECISKLKADMGRDAVILQSRTVRPIFGRFGSPIHEIVAANDVDKIADVFKDRPSSRTAERPSDRPDEEERIEMPRITLAPPPPAPRPAGTRMSLAEAAEYYERRGELPEELGIKLHTRTTSPAIAPQPKPADDRLAKIEEKLTALADAMTTQATAISATIGAAQNGAGVLRYKAAAPSDAPRTIRGPEPYQAQMDLLRSAQLNETLVRSLCVQLASSVPAADVEDNLRNILADRILTGKTVKPVTGKMLVGSFVGATGVGKTTTIAKLSADITLNAAVKVGLITLDTQRVAGTQQLQRYSEIIGVPLRIAYDAADVQEFLEEYLTKGIAIVLVDTPGGFDTTTISPESLTESVLARIDLATYVVLPATLSASNFEDSIVKFSKNGKPTAMILTKVDETADDQCIGTMINAMTQHVLPLAYITDGARVPDDLHIADAREIAERLLPLPQEPAALQMVA
jgi:flagellar biosynthesis protein FlhF